MNPNPYEQAKAPTPFWMKEIHRFDALEVHPVRDVRMEELHKDHILTDPSWCEPCEPRDAHFWSVYGHLKAGHVECFEDFYTEAEARAFAQWLCESYPHLGESQDD